MNDREQLSRASGALDVPLGLRVHAAVFAVVNALLLVINLITSAHYLWVIWPLLGWGTGLALHAAAVYFLPRRPTNQQRMIAKDKRLRSRR
jgi:hypothetical protein